MEKVLNKSQQKVVDVAARNRKAKEAGYESHGARVRYLRWKAVQYVSCFAVIGYVFMDVFTDVFKDIVKWF